MSTRPLDELVRVLPSDLQSGVRDFVEFLLSRRQPLQRRLRQDWAGSLRELRGQYTSLGLQQKAIEWRGD